MSEITTENVKKLRQQTGVSVMQCKKALEEADGDMEQAKVIIQRKSKEAADKKAERELGAGVVQAYVHTNNTVGAIVELSCETDFVAKNEEFRTLAYDIAMHIVASNPVYKDKASIPEEDWENAKKAIESELEGTPEDKREQIMDGKLNAYFSEKLLMEQPFVKDSEKTIGNMIEEAIQKFGENTDVTGFARFSISG